MAGRTFVIAFSIFSLFTISSYSQEKLTTDEVFSWFPEGSYTHLCFVDNAKLTGSKLYPLFNEIMNNVGGEKFNSRNPLPESLKKNIQNHSVAKIIKLAVSQEEIPEAADEQGNHEKHENEHKKEKLLWVFRYVDVKMEIDEALKAEQIAKTGLRINKVSVFQLNARGTEESQKEYYAYPTVTNELLVAENMELLESMIKTGRGVELGLLDDTGYADLFPYVSNLGLSWCVNPAKESLKEKIELFSAEEGKEEIIEKLKERMENGPIYDIENIDLGEDVVLSKISIYSDKELAEKAAGKLAGELDKAKGKIEEAGEKIEGKDLSKREQKLVKRAMGFAGDLLGSQETTVEGNVVTTKFYMGKQQLNTLNSIIKMAEIFKKKHEKKAQAEGGKDN